MLESKSSQRRLVAREREIRALDMRKRGSTFREIGAELGVTTQAAHKAVTRVLDKLESKTFESAKAVVRLELERLDALTKALWDKAEKGDVYSIDRLLSIMRRRADLLGLDAPTKLEHTGKDGGPIETKVDDDLSCLSTEQLETLKGIREQLDETRDEGPDKRSD